MTCFVFATAQETGFRWAPASWATETTAQAALDALDLLGVCRPVVGGGRGIDALVAKRTRDHRDPDVAVDAERLEDAVAELIDAGFAITTDWLPGRIELSHTGGAIVHPVTWGDEGNGVQHGLDGVEVRCLSSRKQRRLYSGYEHTDEDRHDLGVIDGASG